MSQLTDNEVLDEFMDSIGKREDDRILMARNCPLIGWYKVDELKYNRDFQWLMPVWHKFNALRAPEPFDEHWNQMKEHKDCIGRVILHHSPVPTLACALLANAIRWYNTVKQ